MSAQDKDIELLEIINQRKSWSPEQESRIKALLAAGANPNVQNEYGETLLHWPVREGSLEAVKFLIDHGANPDIADQHGQTPLFCAQYWGYEAIEKYLLEKNAKVAQMTPKEQELWSAIRAKNYQKAEHLVTTSGDININAVDDWDATLLHTAIMSDRPEIVELLLKNGANVHSQEKRLRHTPLHFAATLNSNFFRENMNLLLRYGADIEAKDVVGRTPLYCAVMRESDYAPASAEYGASVERAIQLLKRGANPSATITIRKDYNDGTPIGFVMMHWKQSALQQFQDALVERSSSQVSAQQLGRSLSQVTNASSASSSPEPQTEHYLAPGRK